MNYSELAGSCDTPAKLPLSRSSSQRSTWEVFECSKDIKKTM